MRSTRLQPLTTVLALLCGGWAVVAPIVPQLHQTYARHRHVFCVADQRIEDAETVASSVLPSPLLLALSNQARAVGVSPVAASQRNGIECLSSNFSAHVMFGEQGGSPSRAESPESALRTSQGFGSLVVDTLRLAPKTSPPVAG
jgi:hypothetical protein